MRVLCTTIALRSHFFPMVPLVWALRAAGHEVRVAAQPPVLPDVTGAGLPAVEVGAGYDFMTGIKEVLRGGQIGPSGVSPDMRERAVVPHVRTAEAMVADLLPFAERWRPDLVLAEPTTWAAPVVAKTLGVPLVLHTFGPMPAELWADVRSEESVRDNWPKALVAFLDEAGVPLGPDYAACVVDPCPDPLLAEVLPRRRPVRYLPYNGSAVAPPWLYRRTGRPRVCLTWGTTSREVMGPDGLRGPRQILDALLELDVDVVATLGRVDWDVPEDRVRIVDWIPLSLLVPTCAAVINQGGPGTVLAAAAYGVPQLIVPHFSAQPLGAELLTATGAGLSLRPDGLDADAVRAATQQLLSDKAIRAAAGALSDQIHAQPSPADLVPTLESLATTEPGDAL